MGREGWIGGLDYFFPSFILAIAVLKRLLIPPTFNKKMGRTYRAVQARLGSIHWSQSRPSPSVGFVPDLSLPLLPSLLPSSVPRPLPSFACLTGTWGNALLHIQTGKSRGRGHVVVVVVVVVAQVSKEVACPCR